MSNDFKRRLFPRIPQIAEKFGSPFQIDDERGIRETLLKMQSAFAKRGVNFREFYAVKANPLAGIARILMHFGCGFDCSSIYELMIAREVGALRQDIMFTSNNTSAEEYRAAVAGDGCVLNLDDISFIKDVPDPFPDLISFRLNPGNRKTGDDVNPIIGNPVESKYGVPIESIVDAYRMAQERGARHFGLHTMVCSNNRDYRQMSNTFSLLFEVAAKLKTELGIEVEFLNGGGGLGIPYRLGETEFDIESLAEDCKGQLAVFEKTFGFRPRLCLESGRYVTGPHGVLVNRVINVYEKYRNFAGVEVAMPGLMRHAMYGAYHHCSVLDEKGREKQGPLEKVSIVGPICENCDRLATDILLPRIERGDYIVTHDTGAHGIAMGSNYNGRTRPPTLLIRFGQDIIQTSRPETVEDLMLRQREASKEVLWP